MLLWGSAIPMIKMQYSMLNITSDDIGSRFLLAGLRFLIAGLITVIYYLIFRKDKIKSNTIDYRFLLKIALFQITVQYIFYYTGLANIGGVKTSVIQSFNSFIIMIASVIMISDEKITKRKLISLLIGTIGIMYINYDGGFGNSFSFLGEGAIIISITFNGIATVLVKRDGSKMDSFIISAGQFLIGCIPLIILGLIMKSTDWVLSIKAIALIFYGGFLSATAFSLWYMVLKVQSASEFGIYKMFVPIFGSLLSVIALHETFTLKLFIGLFLVLIGILILNEKI